MTTDEARVPYRVTHRRLHAAHVGDETVRLAESPTDLLSDGHHGHRHEGDVGITIQTGAGHDASGDRLGHPGGIGVVSTHDPSTIA